MFFPSILAVPIKTISLLILLSLSSCSLRSASADDGSVKLEFGNSSIVVARGSILQTLGAPNADLKRSNVIRIPSGGVVSVRPPEAVSAAYPSDCRPTFFAIYFTNKGPSSPETNSTFRNVRTTNTKYRGIEKVDYDTDGAGRILDLYRFTSGDLVDFSGRRITFYKGAHRFTTDIQAGDAFRVTTVTSEECFLENAEKIVRQLRSVIFGLTN
jgi:hypothetical protein